LEYAVSYGEGITSLIFRIRVIGMMQICTEKMVHGLAWSMQSSFIQSKLLPISVLRHNLAPDLGAVKNLSGF
jgi:hypothetical protein